MKKKFLLALISFTIYSGYAQDSNSISWHYSVGAVINPDYNINNKLMSVGAHRIADAMPFVSLGWSGKPSDNLSLGVDFGVATSLYGKKNDGYNLVQAPISVKVLYSLIAKEKFEISAGINGSYVFNDLSIYANNSVIDVNNLDPALNTGYIRLNNQSVFAGPSAAFTFLRHKKHPLTLVMGYDFALTNNRWKSDYATLTNSVKENGGRGYIQLNIPFGTIGGMWGSPAE